MTKITTYEQARDALLDMQKQIIHGSQCFAEIAEVMRQLKEQHDAMMAAILGTIGGTVEGEPTHEGNYLQRLRELVEIETVVAIAVGAGYIHGHNDTVESRYNPDTSSVAAEIMETFKNIHPPHHERPCEVS